MNIPRLDLDAAGLGWARDPAETVRATEAQILDYLQTILFYQLELEEMLVDALNENRERDVKKIKQVMASVQHRKSSAQSILSTFRAQHR
jgi:hypothetical protein